MTQRVHNEVLEDKTVFVFYKSLPKFKQTVSFYQNYSTIKALYIIEHCIYIVLINGEIKI